MIILLFRKLTTIPDNLIFCKTAPAEKLNFINNKLYYLWKAYFLEGNYATT